MTNNPSQAKRLQKLVSVLEKSQSIVAQRIGVTRGYMSMLTTGGKPISQRVINAITKSYPKVNIHWLLTGIGVMFLETSKNPEYDAPDTTDKVLEESQEIYQSPRAGILEEALARIAVLEDRMEEMCEAIREIRDRMDGKREDEK